MGRSERRFAQIRDESFRWPATTALHRTRAGRGTGSSFDGRTVLGARSNCYGENRGTDPRIENAIHDYHRYAQHAAGGTHLRFHRFFLHGAAHRDWFDNENFHQSERETDGRLHHREVWMIHTHARMLLDSDYDHEHARE